MTPEFSEAKQNQAKCQMWLGRKRNLMTDRWEETKTTEISVFCFRFLLMSLKKKKKGYLERENENNFCPENQDERYRSQKMEKQKILEHTLQIIACLKSAVWWHEFHQLRDW